MRNKILYMRNYSFRSIFTIISINIFVIVGLIISPSIFLFSFRKINSLINKEVAIDPRALYPIYKNKEISRSLYNQNKPSEYRSYIGWRRKPINLKYIKIGNKYNNRYSSGESLKNSTWFFGGSTMWGTGVRNEGTIPSIFHKKTKKKVFNFGESAWTSRQSLNQLISVIGDGYKPKEIIFYDGINEVLTGCKSIVKKVPTNARENQINNALINSRSGKYMSRALIKKLIERVAEPYMIINKKIRGNENNKSNLLRNYNCDYDFIKANQIASHLVNDWFISYTIAKSINANFIAILQPTIYSSKTNYNYFTDKEKERVKALKVQYETVYPLILEKISDKCKLNKEFCNSFLNGIKWIDDSESKVFLDTFHVSEKGNEMIVNALLSHIKNK